jgi:hypothetical protein
VEDVPEGLALTAQIGDGADGLAVVGGLGEAVDAVFVGALARPIEVQTLGLSGGAMLARLPRTPPRIREAGAASRLFNQGIDDLPVGGDPGAGVVGGPTPDGDGRSDALEVDACVW